LESEKVEGSKVGRLEVGRLKADGAMETGIVGG
jgi:hypothetical protein